MTDETRNQEMRDDATEYQDLVDEPIMPAVNTPLTATEPQSDEDWRTDHGSLTWLFSFKDLEGQLA